MREFTDQEGRSWVASVEDGGPLDYKGRFHLVFVPADGGEGHSLVDVRWNSERTAERTLATMSVLELRRRLRSALGRRGAAVG